MKALDLSGKMVGRWTVLYRTGSRHGSPLWMCRCECGTQREVGRGALVTATSRSCGCLRNEAVGARTRTHGMTRKHPLYRTWVGMRNRCNNPNNNGYVDYGGRGIQVCDRWDSFENFVADMGPRPVGKKLDRRDNDGNYEPGNCRWSSKLIQIMNRRNTRPDVVYSAWNFLRSLSIIGAV